MPEQDYRLPPPILQDHEYLYAAVIELQRIRAALEALAAASAQAQVVGEIQLREPEPKPKPKPKRG
jgi:hypothetical protein